MHRNPSFVGPLALVLATACSAPSGNVSESEAKAISQQLEQSLRDAYDLSKPDLPKRMLSLYPTSGRIISATGGRVVSSRDSLAAGINYFWTSVGANMKNPTWVWEHFYTDVLSPTSAVVSATYRIPHRTPANQPHEIAGAMTEVFEKRDGKWVIVQEHLSDRPTVVDTAMTSMPGMPGMAPAAKP